MPSQTGLEKVAYEYCSKCDWEISYNRVISTLLAKPSQFEKWNKRWLCHIRVWLCPRFWMKQLYPSNWQGVFNSQNGGFSSFRYDYPARRTLFSSLSQEGSDKVDNLWVNVLTAFQVIKVILICYVVKRYDTLWTL